MNLGRYKPITIIIGLAILISHAFILYAIFLEAYFNDFVAVFEINVFGEALLEFILMPITLILGFYAVYQVTGMLRMQRKVGEQK